MIMLAKNYDVTIFKSMTLRFWDYKYLNNNNILKLN